MKRLLILLPFVFLALCCGRRERPAVVGTGPAEAGDGPAEFTPPTPPSNLRGEALNSYMRIHYWDSFDFTDTLFLRQADTMQMLDAYAAYLSMYVTDDPAPLDSLMCRAAVSRPMLEYFWMLGCKVLHDPNSSLRSDELYARVLRVVAESPWLDAWERIGPAYDLRLAMQNRIGEKANDFRYTLAAGDEGTLYDLNADYILLLFGNPDTPEWRRLCAEIEESPQLNELVERGELIVLSVCFDRDPAVKYRFRIPAAWVDAYDKGGMIREWGLYDTKTIPAIYLLDRDKRVLLKGSTSISDVEAELDIRS